MQHGLLNLKRLAEMTGLSQRTLRKLVHGPGEPLPAFRIGSQLRFRISEVEQWLERRRVAPIDVDAIADELSESKKHGCS